MTVNGHRISSCGDENVGCSGSCTTLNILKPIELYILKVNYNDCVFYFKKLAIFKRIEKQNILRFGEGRNVLDFFFSLWSCGREWGTINRRNAGFLLLQYYLKQNVTDLSQGFSNYRKHILSITNKRLEFLKWRMLKRYKLCSTLKFILISILGMFENFQVLFSTKGAAVNIFCISMKTVISVG